MKVKIKENSWLARLAARKLGVEKVAFTLGQTIHLHNTCRKQFLNDPKWLRHELKHVAQFQQYGFIRFVLLYLLESIRHGYYNNRFEREARQSETIGQYRIENGHLVVENSAWKQTIQDG